MMPAKALKTVFWIAVAIAVVLALLWLTGDGKDPLNEQHRSIWNDLAGLR
jgi:hypothetical protein